MFFQTLHQNPGGSFVYTFQDVCHHTALRTLQLPRIKRRVDKLVEHNGDEDLEIIYLIKYGFDVSYFLPFFSHDYNYE